VSANIIVVPRDDVAALMAAIADLEDAVENFDRLVSEGSARDLVQGPVIVLSRIASDIDQQVSTQ
jgi:hypothetical protein